MTKTTDTILRISAKNLASKDVREVSKDIDALAESQKKNATAADLAARSLKDLRAEQRALSNIASELTRRGGLAGDLVKQREEITAAAAKVGELRRELQELQGIKASGSALGDVDKAIKNVEKSILSANRELQRQTTTFDRINERAAKIGVTYENSAGTIKQIESELERVAALQQQATASVDGFQAATVASREALQAQEQVQREITAEAQRRNAVEAAAAAQRRAEAAQRKAELEEQARIRAELTHRFQNAPAAPTAAPVLGPAGDLNSQAAAREAAMRERLVNVIRRQKDGGEKLMSVDGQLAAATRNVTQALNGEASSLDRTHNLQGLFADTGRKSLSVYQRMRGEILSLVSAYIGLYQAANLVKSAVATDQQRRSIAIQLRTANGGDVDAAARDIKFLRGEADRLGLVFENVAGNFANFKIAAKAVGASTNTIRTAFTQATQIVTGLGLSADDADGVFRAFVQILGKARVQAEELRGQLGDRLPGAVAAFAKANNIALSDLDKHLKTGKGTVQEFLKFLQVYAQQTQGAVDAQSKSLFAQFNRLTNSWRDFLVQFAQAGVSKDLLKVVDQLISKLKGNEGAKFAHDLADAFALVAKGVLFVVQHFDTFVSVLKAYLALQATKGVANLGIAVIQTGVSYYKGAKAVYDFGKAVVVARNAGTAMTLAMRGMSALMGPLGVALGILALGFYKVEAAERAAANRADEFVDRMKHARQAQGEEILATVNDNNKAAHDTLQQINEVSAQLERAKKARDDAFLGGLGDHMDHAADAFREQGVSVESLTERLQELRTQHEGYVASVINGSRRYQEFKKQEAAALAADNAQQDNFTNPGTNPTDAELRKAEALKQRKIDIAAAAHETLLKMQEDFDNATIDKAVGTQDQIDANLQASIEAIGKSIERRRTELNNMLNDAKRFGVGGAVNDLNDAIGMLPQLKAEQIEKAKIKAINDSIALGEKGINDLISQRDAEIAIIRTKMEVGLLTESEARDQINGKMLEYKQRIVDSIQALEQQLEALKQSDPDLAKALHVDELVAKLEESKVKAGEVMTTTQLVAKNVGGQLAGGVSNFFADFAKGCAGGVEGVHGIGGAFKYAMNNMREFVADFLVNIGKAILQAILLKAIMNAINGTSGGYGAAVKGVLSGTGHTGGVVGSRFIGSGNEMRNVSSAIFAGAQRFHTGGLPGLRANEVPAILKKGEEVLTEDDPRNVLNGGKGGMGMAQPRVDLAIHNAIDSASVVEAGLQSSTGRKAIFNLIRANKSDFKRLLQD